MKVRYVQPPVGWWQDSRGVHQPPGSYLDPSLRLQADGSPAVVNTQESAATGSVARLVERLTRGRGRATPPPR